jgi:hypothetical protein
VINYTEFVPACPAGAQKETVRSSGAEATTMDSDDDSENYISRDNLRHIVRTVTRSLFMADCRAEFQRDSRISYGVPASFRSRRSITVSQDSDDDIVGVDSR